MSNHLVIVAIPAADDPIWKISSEKIPHLTLLFLGDTENNPKINQIYQFVEHAVNVTEHGPFYLDVDRRDVLGEDKADVIHFRKDWSLKWINQFRNQLLQNSDIRTAYDSAEQFPEWQPHLTLGYPETPAHEDKIPEYGFGTVHFDRIAVWTGNYEGPQFRLEWPEREEAMAVAYSETGEAAVADLLHVGVKGMRWGVRKERSTPLPVAPVAVSKVPLGDKKKTKIEVEGGQNHDASPDAIKVAQAKIKLQKSGPAALSNKELKEVANRIELEERVNRAVMPKGRKFVTKLLTNQGDQQANQFVNRQVKKRVKFA